MSITKEAIEKIVEQANVAYSGMDRYIKEAWEPDELEGIDCAIEALNNIKLIVEDEMKSECPVYERTVTIANRIEWLEWLEFDITIPSNTCDYESDEWHEETRTLLAKAVANKRFTARVMFRNVATDGLNSYDFDVTASIQPYLEYLINNDMFEILFDTDVDM